MESAAAAASVAGILALVGQTIDGLEKLKEFHARLTTASKTVDNFLQDIKSLLQALHGIEEILADWPGEKANVHTASLRVQVEACSKDTFDWLKKAQELRVGTNKGGKAWFKKFWIATSKNKVKDIRLEISRHRNALNTSLALIGRYHISSVNNVAPAQLKIQ